MPFPSDIQNGDRYFNNPDSFAMAFDDKWKSSFTRPDKSKTSAESKLKLILNEVKDHPFFKDNPDRAMEIARFRLRLLKLN